jgi:homoserine kinase
MIRVKVPATSANLGPGFDCMGLALDLWNTFELEPYGDPGDLLVEVLGEGEEKLSKDKSNLAVETLLLSLQESAIQLDHGLKVTCHNDVPCGSGLGSSSTAIVAGLAMASAIEHDGKVDREALVKQAIRIEGHGDNVGPAIIGGLLLIMPVDGGAIVRSIPFEPFTVTVCVPDFDFPTSVARACLPDEVPRKDAVFNLGRAMFVLQALRDGDDALLREAMDDRVHEPYRVGRIPGCVEARKAAVDRGATAVCLSGAGPGLIAFAREKHNGIGHAMIREFASAGLSARHWVLNTTTKGLQVEVVS